MFLALVNSMQHDACITWRVGNGTVLLQNLVRFSEECAPSKIKFWSNFIDLYYRGTGKFFTYVTKIIANLATYSSKLKNYNGIIIFEIDIMKNSSPINLNLCQTWLFHNCFGCFFCFDLLWAELRVQWVQQKRSAILVLTWQKMWILNWPGMSFLWCQSQK